MDKVQVDARKLQLLNDRINQTIDALNQVRISAQQAGYGLSHTSIPGQFPTNTPFNQIPFQQTPYAPMQQNLQHSSWVDPYAAIRQQWELASLYGRQIPTPIGQQQIGGLGHTSFVPRSPAEVLLGVYDPYVRQLEVARANEANRMWELQQGLAHTSAMQHPPVGFGALPFVHPSHIGFVPGAPVIA